jgi:DNA repair protein RecO (recombination protein O)
MSSYSARLIVLRKTKLGETDLIITGFSDEGRQVRAVAKGARKPGSKLGVHLELYSIARVLLHKGRNLDIITEASCLASNEACRADVFHSAGAAIIVETLDKVSADGDSEPRLFPLVSEALRCVGAVSGEGVALIAAAAVLKMAAQLGFRPSLEECVCCGAPRAAARANGEGSALAHDDTAFVAPDTLAFSFEQGGVICDACFHEQAEHLGHEERRPEGGCQRQNAQLITWVDALLTSRFVELETYADAKHADLGRTLLEFAREWLRCHLVSRLKSLDFLLSL